MSRISFLKYSPKCVFFFSILFFEYPKKTVGMIEYITCLENLEIMKLSFNCNIFRSRMMNKHDFYLVTMWYPNWNADSFLSSHFKSAKKLLRQFFSICQEIGQILSGFKCEKYFKWSIIKIYSYQPKYTVVVVGYFDKSW